MHGSIPPTVPPRQGIDSQYIKYCEEESGYVLDPRLRLGLKQRAMVTEMLEMGWLFTSIVRYNQSIDGEGMLQLRRCCDSSTRLHALWPYGSCHDVTLAVPTVPNLTRVHHARCFPAVIVLAGHMHDSQEPLPKTFRCVFLRSTSEGRRH